MYYRPPDLDMRILPEDLSFIGQQRAAAARRGTVYVPGTGRGFYSAFPNASGGTDYLNTQTGRLFLGIDRQNGTQYSINPRTGTQVFSYDNSDGTTDYFNPLTGRWFFAVPDFAR